MPSPTSAAVHVNRPLTNISNAYLQDSRDYIADRIFPVVPVQKQSDLFFKYNKGDFFRDEAQLRGPGTESAGGGYDLSTDSYYAPVYAFHKDVDPQTRANTDDPLNADRDATIFVTHRLALKREILVVQQSMKTGVWTGSTTAGDITPGTKWSAANSTPLEDIEAQIWSVKENTGRFPNRLFIGSDVWKALKNHSEIIARIQYTQRAVVTTDILASLIAPPNTENFEVIVASAIYNTAAKGATDNMDFIAPQKDALLLYAEPNPGIMIPSAGYIFTWSGLLGAGAFGTRISSIPTPLLGQGSERIEGELSLVVKLIGVDLGVYFLAAVA